MGRIYYQVIDITDFGPYVTKLILGMPRTVKQDEIIPEQFNVYVEIKDLKGNIVMKPKSFIERDVFVPSTAYRSIDQVYPCDLKGNKMIEGEYVALEMPYGPIYPCTSALAADFSNINGHESYVNCEYRITQIQEIGKGDQILRGLVFDSCGKVYNEKKDRFLTGISSYAALPLRYGYYVPEVNVGKKPLIIFLHGAGEGGMDLPIAWSGNKVTEFTEKWVQDKFGGAYILVPQCDTMWMNDGSGVYGTSGKSMYTKALKACIDEFIQKNKTMIDTKRVYIGGDSNGGFMTMRMLMSYPKYFAAAFPICEAMIDRKISDKDIAHLKEIPIWFTHAKNDPVVPPQDYVVPTYKRLIEAGAKNVHFTFWDKITDIHAGFKDEKGEPYEYIGHFAWIPMFNDDCRLDYDGKPVIVEGKEVSLMDWLSLQHK